MEKKQSVWRSIKKWYRQNLRRSVIDLKWIILLFFAVIAFAFGYWGFESALAGQNLTYLDLTVLSLRLFLFQTASLIENPPTLLQIARFLAPALTFTTIAFLVLTSLYEHLASWWLRLIKHCHIVICGLGYIGPVIARILLERGYSVVVIEANPENPEIELARDQGAFAITGDATNTEVLKKAGVEKARYLFAVTGDDAKNIDIFNKSSEMFRERKEKIPFTCYTHIENKELLHILGSGELAPFCPHTGITSSTPKYCQDRFFFNIYWIAASCLLRKHPFIPEWAIKNYLSPEKTDNNSEKFVLTIPDIHLLIVGIGTYGENLILQAIFHWWCWFGHTGEKIKITILDKDPEKKKELIEGLYPSLSQHCSMDTIKMDIPSPDFIKGTVLLEHNKKNPFTHVYLCFDNDSLSLTTAIHFQQLLVNVNSYITFRMVHAEQFNSLFKELESNPVYKRLCTFPLVANNCCIDNILCQNIDERLAMLLHYEYLEQRKREGDTQEKNSSCVPWYDLPSDLRDDNRKQAARLKKYIADTKHEIGPLSNWDTPLFRFSKTEVEKMAKCEHDRWMQEKLRKGWIFGPERDNEKKIHNCLVSWEELPDNEKDKDRNAIMAIPRLFAEIGLRVE